MDHIRSLLPKVLKKRGLHQHAQAAHVTQIALLWLQKALPKWKKDITVPSFKDGVLQVGCANSIASQECQAVLEDLKQYLQGECKGINLEDIALVRAK